MEPIDIGLVAGVIGRQVDGGGVEVGDQSGDPGLGVLEGNGSLLQIAGHPLL